ncbi:calcium-translocating P-type ATPase, SERCA-type [Candidatus Woesearchaeota archaeon]|nr:calcium-translocating P-type ATPase, SERCA-type [Candidatus Woesearchaeota archaeon]
MEYYTQSADKILTLLKTSSKGISKDEAEQRVHKYGLNEVQAEKLTSPFKILLEQFTSPLVWILIVAFIISLFLHETVDAVVILLIILLNAILGFVQEYRAEQSIEALKKMASPKAIVLRDGQQMKIDSKYVVPGDILVLETGEKVPADARLIEIHQLQTQEATLTGESLPNVKDLNTLPTKTPLADRKNMVYATTIITEGRGFAVVASTGMNSEVGKIATLIKQAHPKLTPLQKKLRDLGKYLTIAVVIVAIVVFLAGLLSGKTISVMILTAIALAVAAIPEGLPAVITISLALGVQRMVKRNALVRKLPSVETLGSVTVICTDKTGTLTHNEMTVTKLYANETEYTITGAGYSREGIFLINKKQAKTEPLQKLLEIGILCNDAQFSPDKSVIGDPTEAALIVSAEKAGVKPTTKRANEIPFTSERKMMTTFHSINKEIYSYTKGAPDIILEQCSKQLVNGKVYRITREDRKKILDQNEKFAKQALRVLAFAYNKNKGKADAEKQMVFVGLQAMIDPPREEAKDAIKRCHEAGINVIMITGDHLTTAQAIAKELNIEGEAITGQDLDQIKNLNKRINKIGIFARVNPEHKLRIVGALKKAHHVVAMTGDGVNDAPALKKADIGIAMGKSGTDVAREAADMILTDDNFTSIVNAVEEGRGIFDNIRKFVNYLLSSNLGEITVILLASLFLLPLPLTAIQILWVNLITDGLPATALSLDPHSKGIMKRKPRSPRESILPKQLRWDIIGFGVLMGVACLVLFWLYQGSGIMKAQTMVFTGLVMFELVRLGTIRGKYKLGWFSNKWLVAAVVSSIVLHLLTIYTPLNKVFNTTALAAVDWLFLLVGAVIVYLIYKFGTLIARKVTT